MFHAVDAIHFSWMFLTVPGISYTNFKQSLLAGSHILPAKKVLLQAQQEAESLRAFQREGELRNGKPETPT